MVVDIVDCPVCGGWGFVLLGDSNEEGSCSNCGGTGHIEILIEED